MRKKYFYIIRMLVLINLLTLIFYSTKAYATDPFKLYAHAALLMDGESGRVLWALNGKEQRAMASTTKIMTCITALEYGHLNDEVTVSKKASLAPEVKLHIKEGERYCLQDLLYALMLESSNDVAVAIAEHVGGSVESFCDMMTKKAQEIGAYDTTYKTPNGLDADGHFTTAYDLALITRYALRNEKFVSIINTKQKSFSEITKNKTFSVYNKNAFLDMMNGAIGVKTGYTSKAGYCFVGAVKNNDQYFISVVLGSGWPPNREWKWSDTRKIMTYATKKFFYKDIVRGTEKIPDLEVIDGKEPSVKLKLEGTLGLLLSEDEVVKKKLELPRSLDAPIEDHTEIGHLNIYINEKLYKKMPIKTTKSIEKIDFPFCFDRIIKNFLF